MSRLRFPVVAGVVRTLLGVGCLAVSAAVTFAQEAGSPGPSKDAPAKGAGPRQDVGESVFKGPSRCVQCHRQLPPLPPDISRDFCQMNEVQIIREQDKHAVAYKVLESELGQRIGARLGYNVARDKRCLNCHLGALLDEVETRSLAGLTCEACHGPSSRWDQPHSEAAKWRLKPPQEKEDLGMIDVRNPLRRAKLCFSCHIGSQKQGKVVTHEMYAAGHPPLPGIELETFTAAMPRHWRSLHEKGNFEFRDKYLAANPGLAGELLQTKAMLVGGVAALGESLRLVAALSQDAAQPELAAFDCQSCHHELRSPAWRQARQPTGRLGRPRPTEWPQTLVHIGSPAVKDPSAEQTQFEKQWREMHVAFDDQPFGNRARLIAVIDGDRGLVAWLDRQGEALAASPIVEATCEKALRALYGFDSGATPDFHSARQIAWAIRVIELELRTSREKPKFLDRPVAESDKQRQVREESDQRAYQVWQTTIQKRAVDEVNELMKPLEEYLQLSLPKGQPPTSEDFLKESLLRTAAYDPREFRRLLCEAAQRSGRAGIADIEQPLAPAAPDGR